METPIDDSEATAIASNRFLIYFSQETYHSGGNSIVCLELLVKAL